MRREKETILGSVSLFCILFLVMKGTVHHFARLPNLGANNIIALPIEWDEMTRALDGQNVHIFVVFPDESSYSRLVHRIRLIRPRLTRGNDLNI